MAKTQTPKLQPELTEPQIVALRRLRGSRTKDTATTAYETWTQLGTLYALERRGLAASFRGVGAIYSERSGIGWLITDQGLQYLEALDSQETASRMAALESDLAQLQPALEAQRDLAPGDVDQTLIDHAAEIDQELQELRGGQPEELRLTLGSFTLYWAPRVGDVAIMGAKVVILDSSQIDLIRLRGQLAGRLPPAMDVVATATGLYVGEIGRDGTKWITQWRGSTGVHQTVGGVAHELARTYPAGAVYLRGRQTHSGGAQPEPTATQPELSEKLITALQRLSTTPQAPWEIRTATADLRVLESHGLASQERDYQRKTGWEITSRGLQYLANLGMETIQPQPMVSIPMDVVEAVRTCLGFAWRPDEDQPELWPWETELMASFDKVEDWLRTIQTEETKND